MTSNVATLNTRLAGPTGWPHAVLPIVVPGVRLGVGLGRVLATRLGLAAAGFMPVSLIGAAAFGVVGLRSLAIVVLAPVLLLVTFVLATNQDHRRLLCRAVALGVVATFCYDLFRWSFLWSGWMDVDPIPHIGSALGVHPAWVGGYAWRYLGNGGGLAVAFVMLGLSGRRVGAAFGLFVCAGLLGVLLVAPLGEEMLFPLNATTIVMATIGHLIYGMTLGTLVSRLARS